MRFPSTGAPASTARSYPPTAPIVTSHRRRTSSSWLSAAHNPTSGRTYSPTRTSWWRRGKPGRVHLGFKNAFDVIRPQLDPLVQTLTQGRTLWICGHSLGAALATLAADHYTATRGVCTFGSPRVGDPTFARAFDTKFSERSLRYVNDHDVVTHVPLPLGYKHVDVRRFIAPDGGVSSGQPAVPHFFTDLIGQPRALLESIQGLSGGTLRTAPVFLLDHMPKAYAIWTWNDHDAHRREPTTCFPTIPFWSPRFAVLPPPSPMSSAACGRSTPRASMATD
jgi:Predicted lipase